MAENFVTRGSVTKITKISTPPKISRYTVEGIVVVYTYVYVPPNCSDDYFGQLLGFVQSLPLGGDLLLAGDFTFQEIDWDILSDPGSHAMVFCECIFEKNLTQLIREPTHRLGNIVDLVFPIVRTVLLTCMQALTCHLIITLYLSN